jgi:AFG3 family protein
VSTAHERTTQLLTEKRESLNKVAKLLLEREVLERCGRCFARRCSVDAPWHRSDLVALLGERPFTKRDDDFDEGLGWSRGASGPLGGSPEAPQGLDSPIPEVAAARTAPRTLV